MKVMPKLVVATVFAAFGAGAIAQEATPDSWFPTIGTPKSRAEVLGELEQARKARSIHYGEAIRDATYLSTSVKTRDQVRAEVLAARASGELDARGEEYGFDSRRPFLHARARSKAAQ